MTTRALRNLLPMPGMLSLGLALGVVMTAPGHAQIEPVTQWQRTYGGADGDTMRVVRELPDGDLLVVGTTFSFAEHGGRDIAAWRLDPEGNVRWRETFGGAGTDVLAWSTSMVLDDDGGFVVVGSTDSSGAGGFDVYLVKIDGNGEVVWQQTYGGAADDWGIGVARTADGGYVVCGMTFSFQGRQNDMYLAKVDSQGELEWQQAHDLIVWETALAIRQTADGGYLVTGSYLLRVDAEGNVLWHDPSFWYTNSIEPTADGGYIITVKGSSPTLVKRGADGSVEWTANFDNVTGYFAEQTPDGGYLLVGEIDNGPAGGWEAFVAKTNGVGETLWSQTFGGVGGEWATSLEQTLDGGIVVTAYTDSFGAGGSDGWLLKLRQIGTESVLSGRVYVDHDDDAGDCAFGDGDQPFAGRWVRADPGPYLALTGADGGYRMRVEPGTYTVSLVEPAGDPFTVAACQAEPQRTVEVLPGTTVGGVDFGVGVPPACPSLCGASLTIGAAIYQQSQPPNPCLDPDATYTSACPGVEQTYRITLLNDGCPALKKGSLLNFNVLPGMQLVGSNDASDGMPCRLIPSPANGPNVWELDTALPVGKICVLEVHVIPDTGMVCEPPDPLPPSPPPVTPPPWLIASFTGTCQGQAGTTSNVQSDPNEKCDCSCDPNDKQVTPSGCGPYGNVRLDQPLSYRVRFHNVGLGPAHDVVVRDALDDDLDPTRLRLLASSHPISGLEIAPAGEMVIRFDGIELPAEVADPEGSHGFVDFLVEPLADAAEGTELFNKAEIFFDDNEPVITNQTLNTLRQVPEPVADFEASRRCATLESIYDFAYTGGTGDSADLIWDFGPDAVPASAVGPSPTGIVFADPGPTEVGLTVARFGCDASNYAIVDVPDVGCGNHKVWVRHVPPGNPQAARTLCVSLAALDAHLAHGDCLGVASDNADPDSALPERGGTLDYDGTADHIEGIDPTALKHKQLLGERTASCSPGADGVASRRP